MDGQRIAVVTADAAYGAAVNQALTAVGYRVTIIPSGAGDYGAMRKAHPALVILTLSARMPECGWTLFTMARLGFDTRDIPVVLCFQNPAYLHEKKSELRRLHCVPVPPDSPMPVLVAKVESMIGPAIPVVVEPWGGSQWR